MSTTAIQLPEISLINSWQIEKEQQKYFKHLIQNGLKNVLQSHHDESQNSINPIHWFKDHLPIIKWDVSEENKKSISLLLFYKFRLHSSRFIYDMLSKWLVPGKKTNVSLHYAVDFKFTEDPFHQYIMIQMIMDLGSEADLAIARKNIAHLSREIEVGISSLDQGMRILETKDLSIDDKANLVQDRVVQIMEKKPKAFDRFLFKEMQQFFVYSKDSFKLVRNPRHMTRLICWSYFLRKSLNYAKDPMQSKRDVRIRLLPTKLTTPYQPQNVCGILIGLSYLRENESFGHTQIEQALKSCLDGLEIVQDSFFINRKAVHDVPLFYVEIKKNTGQLFNQREYAKLKQTLPSELKDRIEQLMHPIFMPRNEEEIMRNIVNLNKQLKSQEDIPQIIIQFDKQDETHILFTVILLRVLKSDEDSVQQLCAKYQFAYEFIPERIKIVGRLKKGFSKEANVFYVRMPKHGFLRKDHSLDLYRARQAVLKELYRVFSDVRDYNGGMIAKETEVFSNFKKHMSKVGTYSEVLIENYFYSIMPVIVRSIVSLSLLETLFQILIDLLEDERPSNDGYFLKFAYQTHYIFVYISASNSSFKNVLTEAIDRLKIPRLQLMQSFLQVEDTYYFGLIYQSDRLDDRKRFCDVLRKSLELWRNNQNFSLD